MEQHDIERMLLDHERVIHGTTTEPGILTRIHVLEVSKVISDAAWSAVRWGFPILVTAVGIYIAATLAVR